MGQLNNQDWEHSDIEAFREAIIGNGVISGLEVTESTVPAMTVQVSLGQCTIDAVVYAESSNQNLNISNGDATHPRKDIVVYDATAGNPAVVAGTPAAAPIPPDIPSGDILLGIVAVAANESTSIVNADITDDRVYSIKRCAYTAVSANTTLNDAHCIVTVDATGGARTITLPTSVGIKGKVYVIKKTDSSSNAVTVDGNGSETIDDELTSVLRTQYDSLTIVSDNSDWDNITTVKPIDSFSPSIAYNYDNYSYSSVEDTWVKLNEITCGVVTDKLYIGHTWKGVSTYTTDTQIRRNGVIVGTLRSSTSGDYLTSKEEISGWSEGDTIEVWGNPHYGYHGNTVYTTYIYIYLPSPYTFS